MKREEQRCHPRGWVKHGLASRVFSPNLEDDFSSHYGMMEIGRRLFNYIELAKKSVS